MDTLSDWCGAQASGLTVPYAVSLPLPSFTSLAFAGMENADRDAAEARRQAQEAAELAARLVEARPNIDRASGEMERNSPLFHGAGSNPTLF